MNLYLQSDVPEVHELTWIFNCLTTVPYLQQAHAYKDALAKETIPNVGTFDYPMLMAADILIQDADIVPVGKDQKQHVEFARDTAEKFNRIFKTEVFRLPEPFIPEDVAVVPGTDMQKMSKSYNNVIPLFGSDAELKKAVMSIPTDSRAVEEPKDPETCNVYQFHKLFSTNQLEEIAEKYRAGGFGYGDSKKLLLENVTAFVDPMRVRRDELLKDRDYVMSVLKQGGQKARANAQEIMERVRTATGITKAN
jgi:tryptophanyl-tRNA synthetase